MFKRTLLKLNKAMPMSQVKTDARSGLYDLISDIKQKGDNLFGVIYSNQKRHTVVKPVESTDYEKSLKRRNAYDYMNNFATSVLPKIETFVERRLLDKFKRELNQEEGEMVEGVYRMRRHLANLKTAPQISEDSKVGENEKNTIDYEVNFFSNTNGEGLKYHDYSDIGNYVTFPAHKRKDIFPFGCYGDYMNVEYEKTRMFSIMCREEGLKLARAFSNITTHEERVKMIDYESILNRKINLKEEIKNYESFSLYFQEFAYSLLKFLETSKKYEYEYLFTHAEIFDGIVTVLVRFLRVFPFNSFLICPTTRVKIIEQLVQTIHENLGNKFQYTSKDILQGELKVSEEEFYPLTNFVDIVEKIKIFEIQLDFKDLYEFADKTGIKLDEKVYEGKTRETKKKFLMNLASYWEQYQFQWRPAEMREQLPSWKGFNTGVLLTGEGNGKSMILAYLHAWAKECGWFVFPVGDAGKYCQMNYPIERHISGIYFQPELAKELLVDIKIVNLEILKNTRVNLSEYGKFNICGSYDDHPEPNMTLWDHRTQTYTDSWKEYNNIPEEEIIAQDHPYHTTRLSNLLPKPKTLLDIVNFGIEDGRQATCAVAELLHQLVRHETLKTMFLVDNYNELFKPSCYQSYKYANYKKGEGKIPPHDIALCRMFMNFDGHKFKQGVKVCAISLKKYVMHDFKPELIKFPRGYSLKVENLRLNDLRNAVNYFMGTGFCLPYHELQIQDLWQNSQGNWKHLHEDLRFLFRNVPTQEYWLQRVEKKKMLKNSKKF